MEMNYDLIVVGAGSGGIGAAVTAARLGLQVLLLEKRRRLGGTVVAAGVSTWEPGVGGTGLPFEIYRHLRTIPDAVGIYSFGRHMAWASLDEVSPYPGGEHVIDPQRRYPDTLRRYGVGPLATHEAQVRALWHGVVFEPEAYVWVVERMIAATGRCTVRCATAFTVAHVASGHIQGLTLSDGTLVTAPFFVDATGDGVLARAGGAEALLGQDPQTRFNEPDAPADTTRHLNGATLIYRVTPTAAPGIEPLPAGTPAECWWRNDFPAASITHFPNGDLHINMLPTVEGREALALAPESALREARRRVRAHWHHLQETFLEFRRYRIRWIAPTLGIRESWRVLGEAVLTELDLLAGLSGQQHADIIALADHAMDVHGEAGTHGGPRELVEPYGIPYRCLIPRGFDNLLVASRAASFSALAASSCRLSRTMMHLGQAAGTATTLATVLGVGYPEVPPDQLRDRLRAQHVQLDHPMPAALQRYLEQEIPIDPLEAQER